MVFCGTAPGEKSAREKAYYAHSGNAFWRTLAEVGFTPFQIRPQDYPSVTKYGLGLTDVAKNVFGSDSALKPSDFDPDGLRAKILRYKPCLLAFTSKNAARALLGRSCDYGLQEEKIGSTGLFVLCSPSGHARLYWDGRIWQRLAELVKETC